nr:hypothetical protein [Candidatus Paceibacterota bacterium]
QKEYFETRNLITQYHEPTLNKLRHGVIKNLIYISLLIVLSTLTVLFNYISKLPIYIIFWPLFSASILYGILLLSNLLKLIATKKKSAALQADLFNNWEGVNVDEFLKKFCSELFVKQKKPLI